MLFKYFFFVIIQNDPDEYERVFEQQTFSSYIMTLRVKSETYKDEQKVKVSTASMVPINYQTESVRLLEEINRN
jgi:hypothetical protein